MKKPVPPFFWDVQAPGAMPWFSECGDYVMRCTKPFGGYQVNFIFFNMDMGDDSKVPMVINTIVGSGRSERAKGLTGLDDLYSHFLRDVYDHKELLNRQAKEPAGDLIAQLRKNSVLQNSGKQDSGGKP